MVSIKIGKVILDVKGFREFLDERIEQEKTLKRKTQKITTHPWMQGVDYINHFLHLKELVGQKELVEHTFSTTGTNAYKTIVTKTKIKQYDKIELPLRLRLPEFYKQQWFEIQHMCRSKKYHYLSTMLEFLSGGGEIADIYCDRTYKELFKIKCTMYNIPSGQRITTSRMSCIRPVPLNWRPVIKSMRNMKGIVRFKFNVNTNDLNRLKKAYIIANIK